jgi:aspartate/tyrosine/aromatic aminotransferase
MKRIIRGMISNPPTYGARVAAKILNTPELFAQWFAATLSLRTPRFRA